jgi:hypothetical protein
MPASFPVSPAWRPLALCIIVALPMLAGCTYVDRARRGSDLVVTAAQHYKLQALVQADIERQRLRAARCYSPLLTPATISAAAADDRLGPSWVDGLLRDCPSFAAFVSELMIRRGRAAGLIAPAAAPAPVSATQSRLLPLSREVQPSREPLDGEDDASASSEPGEF